jgi:microcystin-dependent protein
VAGFLTLDSIPAGRVSRVVNLPDSQEWLAQFLGNFEDLFSPEFFEPYGALTPAEMTAEWFRIFLDFVEAPPMLLPPGLVSPFAGQVAPAGWLLCHGQTLLRNDYPALYDIIGLLYGSYVSDDEFDIPDLRQKFPLGAADSLGVPWTVGDPGGELAHTLTPAEMPMHTHPQDPHGHLASVASTGTLGTNQWRPDNTGPGYFPTQNTTATNQNAGGGEAHNNMPPYLTLNYIIKI